MSTEAQKRRLEEWRGKYETARQGYSGELSFFDDVYAQYEGNRGHITTSEKSMNPDCMYNFTKELIESQIDSNIPMPKVESNSTRPIKKERASRIEALIRAEMTRLKMNVKNDLDERLVKIMGIDYILCEWDNLITTHDTVGAVTSRSINPKQLIPQKGVFELDDMDYIFLTFEDTKERIQERYGKSVMGEEVDARSGADQNSADIVTQIICFYRNKKRGIGCFSWVGDVILIDDDTYNARGKQVCKKCGKTKAVGEKMCICGSKEWEKSSLEFEEFAEDTDTGQVDDNGQPVIIPALTYARENGEYIFEDYEEPVIDIETGLPQYQLIFDEMGAPVGEEAMTQAAQRPQQVPTKIAYYVPDAFPVAARINVSLAGSLKGDSDCQTIWHLQDATNKLLTKAKKRGINAGTVIAKLKSMRFNPSNEEFAVLDCDTMQELSGIKPINIQFDASQAETQAMAYYQMAKSLLGITETSQGKPDSTATSGVAKQHQIARAEGRQLSKRTMKDMFYIQIFKNIFHCYLAYSDTPRKYLTTDEYGESVEKEFDRYFFLDQDEYGNWHYDDDFTFTVDPTGAMFSDKQFQLEDMRTDLATGMYGDPQDPNTKLMYWKNKAAMNYPGAKTMVAYWQKGIDDDSQRQEQELFAQMQAEAVAQEGGRLV